MQITLTAKNFDLTDSIKDYVDKKFNMLDKFLDKIIRANVLISKDNHHNKGDVYFCECKLEIPGKDLFVSKDELNMYKAIDKVQDHLREELKKHKAKADSQEKQQRNDKREQKGYKI